MQVRYEAAARAHAMAMVGMKAEGCDMAQATPDAPKLKDCPVCDGKGYLRCDCWPGDCICGYGDETCEECSGHGFIDHDDDYGYYEGFQP